MDIVHIEVELTDGNGIMNLIANNELTVSVTGPATANAGYKEGEGRVCHTATNFLKRLVYGGNVVAAMWQHVAAK